MKNSYQTRRLLALRDMRHDGQSVLAGGELFATETDARYLIRSQVARDPGEPTNESPNAAAAAPAPSGRRGVGRPTRAEVAARTQPSVTGMAPEGVMTAAGNALAGAGHDAGGAQQHDVGAGEPGTGEANGAGAGGAPGAGDQSAA